MAGETPVLVYHYRANGAAVIKRNPDLITRQELADIKSKRKFEPSFRFHTPAYLD